MRIFLLGILLFPLYAFASTIVSPLSGAEVIAIEYPNRSSEYFGKLTDFPHTFNFSVSESVPFVATIFVHDTVSQKNDVSIILVKQEKRGVAEIGRTAVNEARWESQRDAALAESFRNGGLLAAELEPDDYILEVSAPNNDGTYRLVLGAQPHTQNYFKQVQALLAFKKLTGAPWYSIFASPLLYVPLAIVALLGFVVWYRRKYVTR